VNTSQQGQLKLRGWGIPSAYAPGALVVGIIFLGDRAEQTLLQSDRLVRQREGYSCRVADFLKFMVQKGI
jgi:hypothetical protein